MYELSKDLIFPHPDLADTEGILAWGGDLSAERLVLAYTYGIFPWYEQKPILWWSPPLRFVLFPEQLKVSKSMQKVLKRKEFSFTYNQNFAKVIQECKQIKRKGQQGTWISDEMENAYNTLHQKGIAKSWEVWQEGQLVAGIYGVVIGDIFCGESMFTKVSNASKAGFISFVKESKFKLFDCQVYTDHLSSLGAQYISRAEFLNLLGVSGLDFENKGNTVT